MRKDPNKLIKRLMVLFAGIIAVFGLTSCTKSFCTNQDKANQLFAYYGNLYDSELDLTGDDEKEIQQQNTHRESLYSTLSETNGHTTLDTAFLKAMDKKAKAFADTNVGLWTNGTIAEIEDTTQAWNVAWHVGIYAGLTEDNKVADLFTNFDVWYKETLTDPEVGVLKAPSDGFVTTLKSTLNSAISSNTACITPEAGTYSQNDVNIYIEGKSWGQAFHDYGFFEGLFVYPFACLVHAIAKIDFGNGWFAILAIVVLTILVRSVTVLSTVFQSKSQARQQKIQPQIEELKKKYPDQNDQEQKRALAMEQSKLMKANKVHPMLPMLFLIIQWPLFICVWSALQGSAALATGTWLGLHLTTTVSTCFTSYASTDGALVGIFIFIIMTITNVLASVTSLFFNSWRTKNFGTVATTVGPDGKPTDPNKTMKWMTIIMSVFVIFMGWSLPTGMGIYWLLGSLISIIQTLLMEVIQTRTRHRLSAETGDGSTLAAVRRSKHHNETKTQNDKKHKNKSDKPMWR